MHLCESVRVPRSSLAASYRCLTTALAVAFLPTPYPCLTTSRAVAAFLATTHRCLTNARDAALHTTTVAVAVTSTPPPISFDLSPPTTLIVAAAVRYPLDTSYSARSTASV